MCSQELWAEVSDKSDYQSKLVHNFSILWQYYISGNRIRSVNNKINYSVDTFLSLFSRQ
jgi:hypothetical protein